MVYGLEVLYRATPRRVVYYAVVCLRPAALLLGGGLFWLAVSLLERLVPHRYRCTSGMYDGGCCCYEYVQVAVGVVTENLGGRAIALSKLWGAWLGE